MVLGTQKFILRKLGPPVEVEAQLLERCLFKSICPECGHDIVIQEEMADYDCLGCGAQGEARKKGD